MAEPRNLGETAGEASPPRREPYDPTRDRERLRGWIAIALVVLLFAVVAVPVIAVLVGRFDAQTERMMTLVLGPVAGLVGTVPGFYFGGKDRG